MKKVLLTLLTLFAVGGVWAQSTADVSGADNAVYAVGGTYVIGQDIALPIYIKNDINAQAATFYVTLQEGLEFVANSKDETAISAELSNADSDHTIMSNIANGMVVLYSPTNSVLPEDMVVLHLKTTSDVMPGEYTITVHDINISNADNGKEVKSDASFESTIYLMDYVVLDENSTTAPEAMENVNVLVKRSVKAGNWSTICLPFTMTGDQVKEVFGGDVELADFAGYETEKNADEEIVGIKVKFNSIDATSGLQANHPCIIKVGETVKEFSVDGVTIKPEDEPTVAAVKRTKKQWSELIGTYVANTVVGNAEEESWMLYLANNKFYYSKGTAKMKAFRAYFDFYDVLADFENAAKIGFYVDGDATSIDGIGTQRVVEGVYDLSGRKIQLENGDLNKLQKGVYIIDGKKVTIK